MTSGWFMTLGAIWERTPLPIKLFSVDRCFRREQAEGPTRLMTYHSASCVVAGEDVTLEAGKAVSEALLSAFGSRTSGSSPTRSGPSTTCPTRRPRSTPATRSIGWVEVATFGLYSPSALAEYGVGVPVMNLGLGVERLAMVLNRADDVRAMVFPQFHPRSAHRRRDSRPRSASARSRPRVEGRRMAARDRGHGRGPRRRAGPGLVRGVGGHSPARSSWSTSRSPRRPRNSSGRPA